MADAHRTMALSLPQASRPDFFERHIRRLAWYTLLASIVLLIPMARGSNSPGFELASALGAAVIVIAVLTVVRDVGRYVRQEQVRRQATAVASQHAGACLAAATIHDRIANLLSVTVGYAELVADAEPLSPEARDHTERAVQAALAATRAVSTFRASLGCEAEPFHVPAPTLAASVGAAGEQPSTSGQDQAWAYDPNSRTIHTADGAVVATLSPTLDRSDAITTGRLMTNAPAMWAVLGDAQHLRAALLANRQLSSPAEVELRTVLERINALASHIQS